jgi:hypothetical protein
MAHGLLFMNMLNELASYRFLVVANRLTSLRSIIKGIGFDDRPPTEGEPSLKPLFCNRSPTSTLIVLEWTIEAKNGMC